MFFDVSHVTKAVCIQTMASISCEVECLLLGDIFKFANVLLYSNEAKKYFLLLYNESFRFYLL